MPYKAKGKCVYKKDTGKKVGCTKGSVKKYLSALHANVKDVKKENSLFERLFMEILEEDVNLKASGEKTIAIQNAKTGKIENVDISDFIRANTNDGKEFVTLVGIRGNDSKTDPTKKAGSEMEMIGKTNFKYNSTGNPSPLGNAKERYDKYNTITLLVSSVDGKSYNDKPVKKRIRSINVKTIMQIKMGRKVYNILR